MNRRYISILSISLMLFSCVKKHVISEWNTEIDISINGILTDSLEFQNIHLQSNVPISEFSNYSPIVNALVQVQQSGITYNFSETVAGKYQSEIPFSIENGETFSVKYKVDTAFLEASYEAPQPITIKGISTNEDTGVNQLLLEIESPAKQYFNYKIYNQIITTDLNGTPDTSWIENSGNSLFYLAEAKEGHHTVVLDNDINVISSIETVIKVSIELTPITKSVKDYHIKLRAYLETLATYNLYVNAPRFYSNQFYGITYATSWTSITHSF